MFPSLVPVPLRANAQKPFPKAESKRHLHPYKTPLHHSPSPHLPPTLESPHLIVPPDRVQIADPRIVHHPPVPALVAAPHHEVETPDARVRSEAADLVLVLGLHAEALALRRRRDHAVEALAAPVGVGAEVDAAGDALLQLAGLAVVSVRVVVAEVLAPGAGGGRVELAFLGDGVDRMLVDELAVAGQVAGTLGDVGVDDGGGVSSGGRGEESDCAQDEAGEEHGVDGSSLDRQVSLKFSKFGRLDAGN